MAKFSVEWMENRTSAKGNKYIRATLKDEGGAEFTDVAIFDKFPDFANIISGSTLEGNLVSKDYQGKTSYTLNSPNSAPTGGFGGAGGVKMMEKKAESIAKSQDRKEEGIKIASVFRASYETALEEWRSVKEGPDGEVLSFDANFRGCFEKWKKYFTSKFEEPF